MEIDSSGKDVAAARKMKPTAKWVIPEYSANFTNSSSAFSLAA